MKKVVKKSSAKKALPKAQLGIVAKAIKGAAKGAVKGGKSALKAARKAETSNLRRAEDWDAYHAAKTDKRIKGAIYGTTAVGLGSMALEKKKTASSKKPTTSKKTTKNK
jgi:hypothetical protein